MSLLDRAPGLTCATCGHPFDGRLARRTETGWTHTHNCALCAVDDCEKPVHSAGFCGAHWHRWRRHGDPLGGRPTPRRLEIEDVEWMVETGENLTGAARRLERSTEALLQSLRRRGRNDLASKLTAREPHHYGVAS